MIRHYLLNSRKKIRTPKEHCMIKFIQIPFRISAISLFIGLMLLLFAAQNLSAQVILIYNPDVPTIAFAAGDIKKALLHQGLKVVERPLTQLDATTGDIRIVLATVTDKAISSMPADGLSLPSDLKSQGFSLQTSSKAKKAFWVIGGDALGAMYGGLELAKKLHVYGTGGVWNFKQNAYIKNRGIKFNLQLDQRSGTYSSENVEFMNVMTKAVWDIHFWEEYLDEMARARYNHLSLWALHPFTVLMKMPGYEDAVLEDVYDYNGLVRRMTIEEKNALWKTVHKLAYERGIKIYWMTWNIWTNGATGKYGITDNIANPATRTYLRKCMKQFLVEFPTVNGFIIHAGEHFDSKDADEKAKFIWETYGLGVQDYQEQYDADKKRDFNFIYRLVQGKTTTIEKYFNQFVYNYDFEIKYSYAHMYNYPAPTIYKDYAGENVITQMKKLDKRTWLNIRNDDMFSLSWGDYDFARSVILNFPADSGDLNKDRYIPGYFVGSDGNTMTRVWYAKNNSLNGDLEFYKHWYSHYAFGYAGYDPYRTNEDFKDLIRMKYPNVSVDYLFDTWAAASRGVPMANAMVTNYNSWKRDTEFFPEGNWTKGHWASIADFAEQKPLNGAEIPNTQPPGWDFAPKGLCGFADYKNNKCGSRENPIEWGNRMKEYAKKGLKGPSTSGDKQFQLILDDIKALSYLGYFYSGHIRAAAHHLKGNKTEAIKAAAEAYTGWKLYAEIMDRNYVARQYNRVDDNSDWSSKLKYALDDYHYVGGVGTPEDIVILKDDLPKQ